MECRRAGMMELHADDRSGGAVGITVERWGGFRLEALSPSLCINGEDMSPAGCRVLREDPRAGLSLEYAFPGGTTLSVQVEPGHASGMRLRAALRENLRRRKAQARGRALREDGERDPHDSAGIAGDKDR